MGASEPPIELLEGVRACPREAWNALAAEESPFLEWEWLASLEECGAAQPETGWAPRPLVARQGDRLLAACPLYVKGHSEGEFVFDWAWAEAAHRAGLDYYPKLLVGVPFTPVPGARILTAPDVDRPAWVERMGLALRALCEENGLSGAHVNFCREDERAPLEAAGFHPRLGFQYHWRNEGFRDFEDYLASLRSKRRNQVKRERREVRARGIRVEARVGSEIPDALFDPMFEIYLATIEKNPFGRQYLNRHFFELLRERFRERLCFIGAWRGEELLAGTVNVQKGDALYGRYWGCFREIRHLHFDVCYYAAVEHCIERGLQRFEPGAGGSYKQLRGFDATPTWSLHWLAEPRLARAVERFLAAERHEAGCALDWYARHTARRRDAAAPEPGPSR